MNGTRIAAGGFAALLIAEVWTMASPSALIAPGITLLAVVGLLAAARSWGPALVAASFALRLLRETLSFPVAFRTDAVATSVKVTLALYALALLLATVGALVWAARRAGWGIPILRIALLAAAVTLATGWVAAGAPAIGALVVLGTGAVFILTALSIPRADARAGAA